MDRGRYRSSSGSDGDAPTTGTFKVVSVVNLSQIVMARNGLGLASAMTGTSAGCDGTDSICCNTGSDCSPTMVAYTSYKVWLSSSPSCTPGVLVDDNGVSGEVVTVTSSSSSGATLFSGSVAPGTYECVIMKMNDTIAFTPNQETQDTFPACTNTVHTIDILKAGDPAWMDFETGGSVSGAGNQLAPSTQQVSLFMTTNAGAVASGTGHPDQITPLASPIVVPEAHTVTMYVDNGFQNNAIQWIGPPDVCWMTPGTTDEYPSEYPSCQ